MRLSDQYCSHLKPSFCSEKSTHKHRMDTHTHTHSSSKSSLTLPMVLHDRLQAALMNTHTKPNQTRIHAHTHSRDGAYLPSPVSVLHFPKELPLKAHRRRAELIILDISEAEQVSYSNNSHCLLSLLNRSGQMSSRELLDKTLWDYHSFQWSTLIYCRCVIIGHGVNIQITISR